MGNRRFSRKRLFESEKLGKAVDLEAGAGIKDAIVSATQHRNGAEIITEIAIDLGTSKATLEDGSATGGVIGVASATDSSITELTTAKYGTITEIRAVMLETADEHVSVSLHTSAVGTDSTAPTVTTNLVNFDAVGEDSSEPYVDGSANGKYLYLEQGSDSSNDGQLSQGKLLIYIHGFEAPSDI